MLTIKDDLKDYVDRGVALEHYSLLDFFLNTYDSEELVATESTRGRPPNGRVPYMENTGHGKKSRVIKSKGHETMPNFAGPWFPRNDVAELADFYCASMLALLQPWRDIAELKGVDETFKHAFDKFMNAAGSATKDIVANIQYPHECSDSTAKKS